MIRFTIITLFPEAVEAYLACSMMWKAREKGLAEFRLVNLREYGLGAHRSVDDTPYGGGDGMLLRCEPVFAAVEEVLAADPSAKVILPTPVGKVWNQAWARELAGVEESGEKIDAKSGDREEANAERGNREENNAGEGSGAAGETGATEEAGAAEGTVATGRTEPAEQTGTAERAEATEKAKSVAGAAGARGAASERHYVILCPHYEGYDERILSLVDYKVSLGKFVLTGGEIPALAIVDSVVRLIPGVLGGEKSAEIESFSEGDNLEYPQYTRPEVFRGMKVPEVLLSGNHGEIAKWRAEHSGKAEREPTRRSGSRMAEFDGQAGKTRQEPAGRSGATRDSQWQSKTECGQREAETGQAQREGER